jgi:hypothetical protein
MSPSSVPTAGSEACTQKRWNGAPSIPGCQRKASAHLVDAVRRARRAVRAEGALTTPRLGPEGDQTAQVGAQAQRESLGGGGSAADRLKKDSGLLGRGRGRLT